MEFLILQKYSLEQLEIEIIVHCHYLEQEIHFGSSFARAREGDGEPAAALFLRHHAGRGHVEHGRVHGGARGVNQVDAVQGT